MCIRKISNRKYLLIECWYLALCHTIDSPPTTRSRRNFHFSFSPSSHSIPTNLSAVITQFKFNKAKFAYLFFSVVVVMKQFFPSIIAYRWYRSYCWNFMWQAGNFSSLYKKFHSVIIFNFAQFNFLRRMRLLKWYGNFTHQAGFFYLRGNFWDFFFLQICREFNSIEECCLLFHTQMTMEIFRLIQYARRR